MAHITSLFDEINKKLNESKQEDDVDQKWHLRNEKLKTKSSIEEVRSDFVGEEENIRKTQRDKLFHNRRIQQNIVKVETSTSLKNKLTIPLDLYEKCNEFKPQVNIY